MFNYSDRYRQLLLISIMVIMGLAVGLVTESILYKTSLEQTQQRLVDTVQGYARLIEAMARYDLRNIENPDNPETHQFILQKIISQLQDAKRHFPGLGKTGEFVLGRRENEQIIFLLDLRHNLIDQAISYHSLNAEPMRRALNGQSGLIIDLDYRGEMVMAAHEPISFMSLGLVAKIDFAELRHPFIFASGVALGVGVIVILLGVIFFFKISEPLIRQAQENALLRESQRHLEETRQALQEKAIYLDNILDSVRDIAIVAIDTARVIKYCNLAAETLHDITADEVIGHMIQDLNFSHFNHYIDETLNHGQYHHELRVTKGGQEFIIESRILPILNPAQEQVGFLLMARDITANRQAQEAVIRSEKKYRLLVESANDAIFVADADSGIILEANRAAENLLQRPVAEIIGIHQTMLHPPEEAEYYTHLFQERVLYKTDTVENIAVIRSDGNRVPVEIRAAVTDLEDRRLILGIFRDVTERKKAEEALRISQQGLAKAQMIARLGSWDWDLCSDHLDWSDEAYRIFGYAPQSRSITFDDFLNSVPSQDRPLVNAAIEQSIVAPYPTYDIEHRIINQVGTEVYVRQQGMLILDQTKIPKRFIGTVQDITTHKNLEIRLQNMNQELESRVAQRTKELERSNLDLQQFAYVASHDLKEPLRLVAGFVQLLEKRYAKMLDEKGLQYIAYVVDGVKHMDALIDSLLSYARLERSGQTMTLVNVEIVLTRVLRYLTNVIFESGATITHDPLPTLFAHEGQLDQLFQNLLSNALKFRTKYPPILHISCQSSEGRWLFSVQDNGIGIDTQYAERIFVIFQKLHSRSSYDGTGIGLALCKRIVERHGGRIWVKSTLGEGSTFFFTIPR